MLSKMKTQFFWNRFFWKIEYSSKNKIQHHYFQLTHVHDLEHMLLQFSHWWVRWNVTPCIYIYATKAEKSRKTRLNFQMIRYEEFKRRAHRNRRTWKIFIAHSNKKFGEIKTCLNKVISSIGHRYKIIDSRSGNVFLCVFFKPVLNFLLEIIYFRSYSSWSFLYV